jgi:multiple sugar transport system permease protein
MATNTAIGSVAATPAPKTRAFTLEQQQRRWGWIFLSPWIIGFFAFTFFPIVASLIFSFTDFNLSTSDSINFVGLRNWQRLATDPGVRDSLSVTLLFLTMAVPVSIVLPLLLATLLNSKYLVGRRFFRTLFYMTYMIPAISSIFVWQSFLNGKTGWLNRILAIFGIEGPSWLGDKNYVLPGLILMGIWGVGNAMLTMLAGLQGVPTDLYEAARVDGANGFRIWRTITVPMISPVILYNLVLSVIGLLQYFVVPYVVGDAGQGRPGGATYFFNVHLYKTAFTFQDMGYGATLAWLILLIALVITGAIFFSARYWVYYSGE